MSEIYTFIFCIGLGIIARLLYLGISALEKRTDLFPVTITLDVLLALIIGAAFIIYIIFSGATVAPYMFAAALSGYYLTYLITRKKNKKKYKK